VNQALLDQIKERIEPFLAAEGVELVDLLSAREKGRFILRFFVDKPGGITLDECTQINRQISQIFDEENVMGGSYVLEVSSPGLDRPLKSTKDFKRCLNKAIRVVLHQPQDRQNVFEGMLTEVSEEDIAIQAPDKDKVSVPRKNIARANLEVGF